MGRTWKVSAGTSGNMHLRCESHSVHVDQAKAVVEMRRFSRRRLSLVIVHLLECLTAARAGSSVNLAACIERESNLAKRAPA